MIHPPPPTPPLLHTNTRHTPPPPTPAHALITTPNTRQTISNRGPGQRHRQQVGRRLQLGRPTLADVRRRAPLGRHGARRGGQGDLDRRPRAAVWGGDAGRCGGGGGGGGRLQLRWGSLAGVVGQCWHADRANRRRFPGSGVHTLGLATVLNAPSAPHPPPPQASSSWPRPPWPGTRPTARLSMTSWRCWRPCSRRSPASGRRPGASRRPPRRLLLRNRPFASHWQGGAGVQANRSFVSLRESQRVSRFLSNSKF